MTPTCAMWFQIVGPIRDIELLAEADSLPALRRKLRKRAKIDSRSVIGRAVCLNAGEYRIDLRIGRKYRVLRPCQSDPKDLLRIVDGSGEDYLYPANWFRMIQSHVASIEV